VTAAPVQECVDVAGIEAGVARFGRGWQSHSVAVMDIFAADASLATADEATQEEILAGRAQFLNAQTAPFQVLVRAEPVDVEGHMRRIHGRESDLPEPLADVARDYVSFLATLAQQRTLLERHCYVVLADNSRDRRTVWEQCKGSLRRLRTSASRRSVASDRPDVITTELARRLSARCDLVGRHLSHSGLRTRRPDSRELAELLRRCWAPDLARVQRLRDELGAYTSLFVSADHSVVHARTNGRASSPEHIDDAKSAPAEPESDDHLFGLAGAHWQT
jgi:hypothetical protein